MGLLSILLLGVGLSLDTFAVSLTLGCFSERIASRQRIRFLVTIGMFHFLMILAGWAFGESISGLIAAYDHWIAFALLSVIGIQMIREGFSPKEEAKFNPFDYKVILTLAVATSIDAMAVGVSMAFMQLGNGWEAVAQPVIVIAALSSLLTIAGLGAGILAGRKIPFSMTPVGGIILIGIGIKIIIEHLNLWP